MERLLNLPVELRLQIYEHVLCDEQLEIDVSEYWLDEDPKLWERFGRPLAQLDPDLAFDIYALHWSRITITYSECMQHSISTSDQKFVYWLFAHADMARRVCGSLRFQGKDCYYSRCNSGFFVSVSECTESVTINFKNGEISVLDGRRNNGNSERACKTRSMVLAILDKIRRDRGQLRPRLRDLWGLYEVWRLHFSPGSHEIPWARDWTNVKLEYSKTFRCPNDPATRLFTAEGCRNDLHDVQQMLSLSDSDFEHMIMFLRRPLRRHGYQPIPPERPYISSLLELDLWIGDSRKMHWPNSYQRDRGTYQRWQTIPSRLMARFPLNMRLTTSPSD